MAWRRLSDGPDGSGGSSQPARLGDMLDRVLARLGVPSSAGVETAFERWHEVVGETMAARTRPVRIDGDTLVVACDEAALASHVRFLESEIVTRLAELGGDRRLRRIAVRVEGVTGGRRSPRRGA